MLKIRLSLALAVSAWLGSLSAATACEKQNGSMIYSENFADTYGGWDLSKDASSITPPSMLLAVGKPYASVNAYVLTFSAADGDYCMDFVFPSGVPAANQIGVGLEFWAADYNNLYLAEAFSNGVVALYKRSQGNLTSLYVDTSSAVVTTQGATNSIRVVTKGSLLSFSVNGTHLFTVRAQVPAGSLRFGVYAQVAPVGPSNYVTKINSFTVTSGQ